MLIFIGLHHVLQPVLCGVIYRLHTATGSERFDVPWTKNGRLWTACWKWCLVIASICLEEDKMYHLSGRHRGRTDTWLGAAALGDTRKWLVAITVWFSHFWIVQQVKWVKNEVRTFLDLFYLFFLAPLTSAARGFTKFLQWVHPVG